MDNKVITSQGNVQFQFPDGKIINVHPNHIYTVFNEDTVNFVLVGLPKSSGLAMMASKAEDLEVNGQKYTIDELPSVIEEAFAIAGAQARCEIVDELPETGYTNTIYLVPQPAPQTGFDEYVYILDQGWELIGDTSIEMDNYVLKTVFSGYTADTAVIINNEISARTQGDITLNAKIDQEIVDRASDVDAEEARAISAETALQTAIDDEISAREAADTAEQTAREAADTAEQTAREAADSFISGAVDTVSSGLTQEVQRAQNAESGLSDSIDAEATRATTAENALSGAIDTLDVRFFDDAKYEDSGSTKVINFYNGNTIKATIDASDFIVDGMVEDVRIENGYLVIDFNTASGKQDIQIPLTDIFNPNNYYQKSETSGATEISTALAQKLAVSDFNTYSGEVSSSLAEKALQSDLDTLNDTVTAHTNNNDVHVTSSDKTKWNKVDDKLDVTDFNTYSASTDTRLAEDEEVTAAALNAINDRLAEDEEVTAAALNELNEAVSGKVDTSDVYLKSETSGTTELATAFAATQPKLSAGTGISIDANNVISATGGGGGGEVSSAITSGDTNAVAGGAVFDAVVYSGNTYTTELTFDADGYAENWVVGTSAITIDVSGYTASTTAHYHFENSNGEQLGEADITKNIYTYWTAWTNSADNCTITTDGDTATTAIITDIPSGTVKVKRTDESNPPKAIISATTPETWIKDALDDHRNNTTIHITSAERTYWNNKSNFSGSYNDLTDKPIPDSALNVASTNPVQNQALYSELRLSDGVETETTLVFENNYSTNYPNGCTKIKVEVVGSNNDSVIIFLDNDDQTLGNVTISNYNYQYYSGITVDNSNFQAATYEISGTTVILSYPTATNVARIRLLSGDYVYKAITTSTTPLKDQVVANTTALGGLSLVKLTESEYEALVDKNPNVLYVVIPDPTNP